MTPSRLSRKELIYIGAIILLFLFIRLARFADTFHFYYDQPLFSLRALEIWRSFAVPLIGPPISFTVEGRQIFQGGVIYIVQLLFLLIGGFDPMRATLFFVVAASLMTLPLFVGVKKLAGSNAAILATIIYAALPPFVTGTLELTNPYYQLALCPLLVLALGIDKEKKNKLTLIGVGLLSGFLLMFHYQFVLVIVAILIYYLTTRRLKAREWVTLLFGMGIGFGPIILFEFRNNFYNLRTILFFLQQYQKVGSQLPGRFPIQYFLSPLLSVITGAMIIGRKWISPSLVLLISIPLIVWSLTVFVINPTQGGILKEWSYANERHVASIISEENLTNYNVAAWYDTKAITQKYFIALRDHNFDAENYRTNQYLFVIYPNDKWTKDGAYELNTFVPSSIVKKWPISSKYNLYLAKRERAI